MKPLMTAIFLSLAAAPSLALGVDVGGIFPTPSYPEANPAPAADTVTKDNVGPLK